jgi:ElaB/YqjD/DUF883 family membrane-anchored ribosome-binding protein
MTTTTKKPSHESENGLSEILHDAGERVVELKDESVRTLGKSVDSLGKAMKEHPLLAVGLGVGAGYLIARLVHRG